MKAELSSLYLQTYRAAQRDAENSHVFSWLVRTRATAAFFAATVVGAHFAPAPEALVVPITIAASAWAVVTGLSGALGAISVPLNAQSEAVEAAVRRIGEESE